MAVKIRLQRKGRTKAPFYHIVIADARAPRDGRFIEKVGTYNPLTVPATIALDHARAFHWLMVGAQPTDTVEAILRFKGVMYHKHLQIGVNKGAISQEDADAKLAAWMEDRDNRNVARKETVAKKKEALRVTVDGVAKIKVKPVVEEPVVEETVEVAPEEVAASPVVEEIVAAAPEVVAVVAEAAAPAVEEAVAVVAEAAAPAVEEAVAVVAEEAAPAVEEAVAAVAEEAAPAVEEAVAAVAEEAAPAVEEAPEASAAEETSTEA
jgi:small subunit ribosomal protein S16